MSASIFKCDAQTQINYFKVQTGVRSTASLNEMIVQRFQTLLGTSVVGNHTISDLVWRRLNNLGYRGSVGEQLNNFFAVKSGRTDRVRAEQICFLNTSSDFT